MQAVLVWLVVLLITCNCGWSNSSSFNHVKSTEPTVDKSLLGVIDLFGSNECDYSGGLLIRDQIFHVTMDTGSSNLAIASAKCCPDVSPVYAGSTDGTKNISVHYGSGEWTGNPSSDNITLGGIGPFAGRFSVMSQQTGIVGDCDTIGVSASTQGIFGLAYPTSDIGVGGSFLDVLCNSGVPNGFAMQLCGYDAWKNYKQGNMWIGGYSSHFTAEEMQFVKIVKKEWYEVNVLSISVEDEPVHSLSNVNDPRSIVDSGTTDIIFNNADNHKAFLDALKSSSLVEFGNEKDRDAFWAGDCVQNVTYVGGRHGITFDMEGENSEVVSIPLPASNLFVACTSFSSASGSGLRFLTHRISASNGTAGTILGSAFLEGYVVFFDRGEPARIGFALGRNCNDTLSVDDIDNFAGVGSCWSIPEVGMMWFEKPWVLFMIAFVTFLVTFCAIVCLVIILIKICCILKRNPKSTRKSRKSDGKQYIALNSAAENNI